MIRRKLLQQNQAKHGSETRLQWGFTGAFAALGDFTKYRPSSAAP